MRPDSASSRQPRIRPALPGEAAALSALAWESKAHWAYPAEVLQTWSEELSVSASDVVNHITAVAEVDGARAGFYMLKRDHSGHLLEHLWVTPSHMRQGIGSALLSHALQSAAAQGAACVTVVSDPNAAAFYEKQGGRLTGAVAAPLPGAADRVLPVYRFRSVPE